MRKYQFNKKNIPEGTIAIINGFFYEYKRAFDANLNTKEKLEEQGFDIIGTGIIFSVDKVTQTTDKLYHFC